MAADTPPTPVVLRIKVRYEDPDAFVERFAPFVARAGLFLRSKQPKPVGTEVRFELRLANDAPVLVGMGVVRWAREVDPARPTQPPGMAIEFTRVTKESRGVILKMLELRRKLGLTDGPRGLPVPPDDDHAITAASTASATATDVRAAHPAPEPALPSPASEPPAAAPEPLRPQTTLRGIAPGPAPAPLGPMRERVKRPSPAEVIAAVASTPMADAFGEMEIEEADLGSVMSRARAMVGADADAELAALLEEQAVPVIASIEEASARLAALFGTSPVSSRRRRADDSVPAESRPAFTKVPAVAQRIEADLVPKLEPAPEPPPPAPDDDVTETDDDDDPPTVLAVADKPAPASASDQERTRVVAMDELAASSASEPEPATRVVHLDSLIAATAARDDDERTRIAHVPDLGDDERTHIVSSHEIERATRKRARNELDFDRRDRSVPRDFADEPEGDQETAVRARPHPTERPPAGRAARRTTPPPPPPGRSRTPSSAPPLPVVVIPPRPEPVATDDDDDALTPPPVSGSGTIDLRKAGATTSSGTIELDDLVAELERDIAPVRAPAPARGDVGDLGASLGGEALDAEGLIADFGTPPHRRRAPDGPFPDLASFADPPSSFPRNRDALDATLAALDGDDGPEERTSFERPLTSPRATSEGIEIPIADDDEVEIEIEVDDD